MKAPLEREIQRDVLQYLSKHRIYAAAIPNGSVLAGDGKARAIQSNALKRTGMRPGFPDLILIQNTDNGARIGFFEVKREGGKMSPEQVEFQSKCAWWHLPFAVVRSVRDAEETLAQWGWIK